MTCGRAWPRVLDRIGQRLELRRAARDQDERMAVVGEHIGQRRADAGGGAGDHGDGFAVRPSRQGPANFAITSCGIGFDLIFSGSSGSRSAQTRVSKHSTQSSPSSVRRCCDVEARPAEFRDLGLDHHVVAELGRLEEARPGVDHRVALEFVVLGELILAHAQRLREQRGGAAVEHREIARKEHDAGRVAVAPFDPCVAGVGPALISAAPCGARRRAGSLRR